MGKSVTMGQPGQFNYVAAWQEVARVGYASLPQDVRALVQRVAKECADLRQGADLDMPWPREHAVHLRDAFEGLASVDLARAARLVHAFGHWAPGDRDASAWAFSDEERGWLRVARSLQEAGAYWKFSNYADQVLTARCAMVRTRETARGVSFAVHEGTLRVCYSGFDCWVWREVGWATEAVMAKVRAAGSVDVGLDRAAWERYRDGLFKACASADFREAVDTSRFQVPYSAP